MRECEEDAVDAADITVTVEGGIEKRLSAGDWASIAERLSTEHQVRE